MDLTPFLTQSVKTQNPLNGELSHGIISQAVHQGVQAGRGTAAGSRGIVGRGGAGVGSQPQCIAPLAACVSAGARQCVSRQRAGALERGPDCRVGTEDRSAGFGDRFFEGVLAAHRGTADAAGIDWKAAVYRKVAEEAAVGRRLSSERMVELGRVSRSGFYRCNDDGEPCFDPAMDTRDSIQSLALAFPI